MARDCAQKAQGSLKTGLHASAKQTRFQAALLLSCRQKNALVLQRARIYKGENRGEISNRMCDWMGRIMYFYFISVKLVTGWIMLNLLLILLKYNILCFCCVYCGGVGIYQHTWMFAFGVYLSDMVAA